MLKCKGIEGLRRLAALLYRALSSSSDCCAPKWMWVFMESSHAKSAVWKIHKTQIQRIFITTHNSFQCLCLTCSHTTLMHISMNCIFRDGLRWCHSFYFLGFRSRGTILQINWSENKQQSGQQDDLDLRSENVFEQIAPFYLCN